MTNSTIRQRKEKHMIIWINGAFGSGKTTIAELLNKAIKKSCIYDPENIGIFFMKNLPREIQLDDFQDYPEWRQWNLHLLLKLATEYDGDIIVPMTLYREDYFSEVIGGLKKSGIRMEHFQLDVSKKELIRRLEVREKDNPANLEWGKLAVDKILEAFCQTDISEKIINEHRNPDEIVKEILEKTADTTN
nr:AAA family ATPase [Enterococcus sp. BWT-B8]